MRSCLVLLPPHEWLTVVCGMPSQHMCSRHLVPPSQCLYERCVESSAVLSLCSRMCGKGQGLLCTLCCLVVHKGKPKSSTWRWHDIAALAECTQHAMHSTSATDTPKATDIRTCIAWDPAAATRPELMYAMNGEQKAL
jgi:hypothetical protein